MIENVCCYRLCHAYCCGLAYLEVCIARLNVGDRNSTKVLKDTRPAVQSAFFMNLTTPAETINIELIQRQLAAPVAPNTMASLSCFAWMQSFFDAVGDKQPNYNEPK